MRIDPVSSAGSYGGGGGNTPITGQAANMSRLSRNRLEAMNQLYTEAAGFNPSQRAVKSNAGSAPVGSQALQRYKGTLEEWKNYLQFKKEAAPQYNPKDGVQMRAVDDRLSMLSDVTGWLSDKLSPAYTPKDNGASAQLGQSPLARQMAQPTFTPPAAQNPFSQSAANNTVPNPFKRPVD